MRRSALLVLVPFIVLGCGGGPKRPAVVAPPSAVAPAPPRPEELLARARALRAEGDLAGARDRLEAALAAGPASDELRLESADLLVADGRDLPRARALLDGVALRDARFERLSAQLADLQGDDAAAADAYARALATAPDADLRLRRALALERLGRGPEAIAELEAVKRERPGDPVVRAHLAERYEVAGRLDDAEAELVEMARAAPDRSTGWDRLARFYDRTARPEKARAARARERELSGIHERALRPLRPSSR